MQRKAVLMVFLILIAAEGRALGEPAERFELDSALGWAGKAGGMFKSFGYHLIQGFVLVEVSFALFQHSSPLSANLTLQVPLGPVFPYVSGGYGYSLSGFMVSNMAAGLKFWVSKTTGLLVVYKQFRFTYKQEKKKTTMIGVGFAYRF